MNLSVNINAGIDYSYTKCRYNEFSRDQQAAAV